MAKETEDKVDKQRGGDDDECHREDEHFIEEVARSGEFERILEKVEADEVKESGQDVGDSKEMFCKAKRKEQPFPFLLSEKRF